LIELGKKASFLAIAFIFVETENDDVWNEPIDEDFEKPHFPTKDI